jgi:hypothetical protein
MQNINENISLAELGKMTKAQLQEVIDELNKREGELNTKVSHVRRCKAAVLFMLKGEQPALGVPAATSQTNNRRQPKTNIGLNKQLILYIKDEWSKADEKDSVMIYADKAHDFVKNNLPAIDFLTCRKGFDYLIKTNKVEIIDSRKGIFKVKSDGIW